MPSQEARERVAKLLDALADGEAVQLGDFSDAGSETTDADVDASILRDLVDHLRG